MSAVDIALAIGLGALVVVTALAVIMARAAGRADMEPDAEHVDPLVAAASWSQLRRDASEPERAMAELTWQEYATAARETVREEPLGVTTDELRRLRDK